MKKILLAALLWGNFESAGFAACPQPTPCDAYTFAQYADAVYSDGRVTSVGCDAASIPSISSDGQGFYAAVYGNATSGYVLAFRGTQGAQDLLDDLDQGLNGDNLQFAEARSYFEAVESVIKACSPDATLTLVGHSLGGALAQYAAATPGYNCCAMTFNPAALLPAGTDGDSSLIHNYVNGDDILHDIINPLLAQVAKTDPTHVASGYFGSDTFLGNNSSPYDFSNINISASDLQQFQNLLSDLEDGDYSGASDVIGQIANNDSLKKVIGDILQRISPNFCASFQKLCDDVKQVNPLALPGDWSSMTSDVQTEIGSRVQAHLMGNIVSNTSAVNGEPLYTPGSMLDLLQKQCNQQLGIGGTNNSPGSNDGGNGYPTVPGGCFGNLPLNDGMPSDFLDLMGQMVDAVGSQSGQDALGNASSALDVLDQFTDLAKAVNLPDAAALESLGKYTGPLGDVLQILSIGGQLVEMGKNCMTALASGSEQNFVNAINEGAKDAVASITSMLGAAAGTALGGAGGTAIGGPIGTILGGFAGGWLGGQLGQAAGDWLYGQFMKDWVTKNIAEPLFNLLCPQNGGVVVLPPSTSPGNTGSPGSNGSGNGNTGSSGQPGAGITNPSQIINSGTSNQPSAPPAGSGYQRDPNYRKSSK